MTLEEIRKKNDAPNMYKPWTKEEQENLLNEIHKGDSFYVISKTHMRTEGGIISRLKSIAVEKIDNGASIPETSNFVKLSEEDIYDALYRQKMKKNAKENLKDNPKNNSTEGINNILLNIRDILLRIESKL